LLPLVLGVIASPGAGVMGGGGGPPLPRLCVLQRWA